MSYPGEPDRFFEKSGGLVGEEICSVSIGGDSSLIFLEELGDVAGQSHNPRNVVKNAVA